MIQSDERTELSELIVTCHHAIADGIAVTYLIRDILQAMTMPTAFRQSLPVSPPLEDLMVRKSSEGVSLFKPLPQFISDSYLIEQRTQQNSRSLISSGSLSSETTQLLVACCRQEQTSVHAAICAAFMLAVRQQNYSEQPQTINCASPVNLRSFLPTANQEDVNFCIGAERSVHCLSVDTHFWELARSAKRQLKQKMVSDKLVEKILQLQAWASTHPSADDALQAFKDQLDYDIAVSNLTRLTIAQQFRSLEIQAIYGPVVRTGVIHDRLVGVATLGDQLFFTLACSESLMSRIQMNTLQQEAMHLLHEATKLTVLPPSVDELMVTD